MKRLIFHPNRKLRPYGIKRRLSLPQPDHKKESIRKYYKKLARQEGKQVVQAEIKSFFTNMEN